MSPDLPDFDRLAQAISESRRLIDETKRLLEKSSEILVPPCSGLVAQDRNQPVVPGGGIECDSIRDSIRS